MSDSCRRSCSASSCCGARNGDNEVPVTHPSASVSTRIALRARTSASITTLGVLYATNGCAVYQQKMRNGLTRAPVAPSTVPYNSGYPVHEYRSLGRIGTELLLGEPRLRSRTKCSNQGAGPAPVESSVGAISFLIFPTPYRMLRPVQAQTGKVGFEDR